MIYILETVCEQSRLEVTAARHVKDTPDYRAGVAQLFMGLDCTLEHHRGEVAPDSSPKGNMLLERGSTDAPKGMLSPCQPFISFSAWRDLS